MNILDFSSIDLSLLSFKPPEKIKGSFMGLVDYNSNDIVIKTPLLKNINGLVKTDSKTYLDLEFGKENLHLYEFLCNLDEYMIKTIHENSKDWFNTEFPLDVIEDFYVSILKHKQVPKLRIVIPTQKGELDCNITDTNNVKMDSINENENISIVLKFIGLKFLKQKVISEWVPLQIINNCTNEIDTNLVLNTDNIDLEIENYLDTDEIEDYLDDKTDINIELESNEELENNDNTEQENYSNDDILEHTKNELNKYKLLSEQNESKFNELKQSIIKCLEL